MKRAARLLLITGLAVAVVFAAYGIYNKTRPEGEVGRLPGQEGVRSEDSQYGNTPGQDGQTRKEQENSPEPETEAYMAPDFSLKEFATGNKVSLSDYRGKIVVLNFWTTWCGYCKDEMPDLERVGKEFAKRGDAVLLTINVQEDDAMVDDYLKENQLDLPVLMDYDGSVALSYGVGGYPSTYFIYPDGTAAYVIPYRTDEDTILETVNTMK